MRPVTSRLFGSEVISRNSVGRSPAVADFHGRIALCQLIERVAERGERDLDTFVVQSLADLRRSERARCRRLQELLDDLCVAPRCVWRAGTLRRLAAASLPLGWRRRLGAFSVIGAVDDAGRPAVPRRGCAASDRAPTAMRVPGSLACCSISSGKGLAADFLDVLL